MAPPLAIKRSACDRCRVQKLRCPPSTDGSKACLRCTRLGAQCMTSYPRPSNASLQAAPQELPPLRPKTTGGLPTPNSTIIPAKPTSRPTSIALGLSNTPPQHRADSAISTIQTPFDPLSFSLDDNFDYFSSVNLDIMSSDPTVTMFSNDNQSYQSPSPTGTNDSGTVAEPFETSQAMQLVNDIPPNTPQNSILQYNTRLTKLNLDLSNRIEQCLNCPFESMALLGDSRSDSNNIDNSMADQLFEQALHDLSEFLNIIQSYTTKRNGLSCGSPAKSGGDQNAVANPSQRISLVVFLNLISAYLQIIVIYDRVVRRLSLKLFGDPLESLGANSSNAGDVRMSGLSSALQTKILVHAILHQFDVIERMLGLPADLRVTDKQSTYSGLFEDDRARGLLGAVSNGIRIEHVWGQVCGDDPRTSKALSGLRESLRLIEAFLNA